MSTASVVSCGYLATVDGVRGRVRAVFPRCAYVVVEGGGPILVLHASGGDHTPTSLCPARWPPAEASICVGDAVVGRAGRLKVGRLVLDVRGARVWRPSPPLVDPVSLADPGAAHRHALRAADVRTGDLLAPLERALGLGDGARVTGCVASLVGLGPGLTPSGDDALVGLLAALHRLAAERSRARLLGGAVVAHLDRTADISAHYLRLAVAGHVGEQLVALCDAVAHDDRCEVEGSAAAVVATGATSGADALLGVVAGLRIVAAAREQVAA